MFSTTTTTDRRWAWFAIAWVLAFGVALGVAATWDVTHAGASEPAGSSSLEWRVSHLEGDMRGAYANTSNHSLHIQALQVRVGALEAQVQRQRELIAVYLPRTCAVRTWEDHSGAWDRNDTRRYVCADIIASLTSKVR
jgi:hypothetical protein